MKCRRTSLKLIKIADVSMQNAVNEFRFIEAEGELPVSDNEKVSDITISGDGSWQKRGHSSLSGVVTIIADASEKCLDNRVLSKTRSSCQYERSVKKLNQNCTKLFLTLMTFINHKVSSGFMEASDIVEFFMTSESKLRYTHYIGDGYSKTHIEIVKSDPYNGLKVEKLECVGHVRKQVGAQLLRKLKNTVNGKHLDGKGRLTEYFINMFQNYFCLTTIQCLVLLFSN